jgi:hypothetical protein
MWWAYDLAAIKTRDLRGKNSDMIGASWGNNYITVTN